MTLRYIDPKRLNEARTPTDPMPSDSALAKLWVKKRDMLSDPDSRYRYITYWHWDSMPVVESNIIYGTEGQDFGVLNQGAPVMLKYDPSIGAKLDRFGLGNEVNYIAK